jgi:hypothetical protein
MGGSYEKNKTKAENYDKLASATQDIVGYFHELSAQTAQLDKITSNPPAGPNSSAAIDIIASKRVQPSRKPSTSTVANASEGTLQ